MKSEEFLQCLMDVNTDLPDKIREWLTYFIKTGDLGVRSCFFKDEHSPDGDDCVSALAAYKELSVLYVSYCIGKIQAYSFDQCVNISYSVITQWFADNKEAAIREIYKRCVQSKTGVFFDSYSEWGESVTETLCGEAFCNGIHVETTELSFEKARLILYTMKLLDETHYQRIYNAWSTVLEAAVMCSLTENPWLDTYQTIDILSAVLKPKINERICCIDSTKTYEEEEYVSGTESSATFIVYTYQEIIYGQKAAEWLNSANGPCAYGVRTTKKPQNVQKTELSRKSKIVTVAGGCVVEHTKITLADGSTESVQNIKANDHILSEGGSVSVCSTELVRNNKVTALYGINGVKPFLSLEHALKTRRGWRSLAPDISNEINRMYDVRMLQTGDIVTILDSYAEGKPVFREVEVESIEVSTFKSGQLRCFDLHFAEGKNSYFANGFLCLLNYPELTSQRIADNIRENMTPDEMKVFLSLFTDHAELMEKAIGQAAVQGLLSKIQE